MMESIMKMSQFKNPCFKKKIKQQRCRFYNKIPENNISIPHLVNIVCFACKFYIVLDCPFQ